MNSAVPKSYERMPDALVARSFFSMVHKLLALIVIAWMNNGISTFAVPHVSNYLRWILFFAWFGIAIANNSKFVFRLLKQCWPLFVFLAYIFFVSFFNDNLVAGYFGLYNVVGQYIKNIPFLIMVYSIFLYYFEPKYRGFQKVLFSFLLLDYVFVAINTHLHLRIDPQIARYLTAHSILDLDAPSIYYGIGTYSYFYSLVSIILLFGFLFLNHRKQRIFILASIIALSFVLIEASFTMALLFAACFLALLLLSRFTNRVTFSMLLITLGASFALFRENISHFFEYLATANGISDSISIRLIEISSFLSGNSISGSDLGLRLQLYSMSINSFVHNIALGSLVINDTEHMTGMHSAWFDTLSYFGLFSIFFFMFLFKAYKYAMNIVPVNGKTFVKLYWAYFILLGLINTAFFTNIFVIWFLLLPMALELFFKSARIGETELVLHLKYTIDAEGVIQPRHGQRAI